MLCCACFITEKMTFRSFSRWFADHGKSVVLPPFDIPSGYLSVRHGEIHPFFSSVNHQIFMGHLYHGYVSHNQMVFFHTDFFREISTQIHPLLAKNMNEPIASRSHFSISFDAQSQRPGASLRRRNDASSSRNSMWFVWGIMPQKLVLFERC